MQAVKAPEPQKKQQRLHELEVLELRRVADLALDLRRVRDQLLEKVSDLHLKEPIPGHGEHDANRGVVLYGVLETKAEFISLRQAIEGLPRDIREKLWVVEEVGRGEVSVSEWDVAISAAVIVKDSEILTRLLDERDLHEHIMKGLYLLGASEVPGDTV